MNFDFTTLINNVRSVAVALSLERILKICLILFIGGFLFLVFERRIQILHWGMQPLVVHNTKPLERTLTISPKHIVLLQQLLQKTADVNSIVVVSVNIRENVKQVIFSDVAKHLKKTFGAIPLEAPLFTDHEAMNQRSVVLIGGGTICAKSYGDTIGTIAPNLQSLIPYSCAIPIPPVHGDFSGWIFVGFDKEPSTWELQQFKIEIFKISSIIKRGA